MTKKTDRELVQMFRDHGDIAAFEELFQRYCHLVYGACLKYFGNEEDSKDAVLEIFEKVMTKLKIQPVTNFSSWLYSITKNFCLYNLRKNKTKENIQQKKTEKFKNIFMEFEDFDTLNSGQSDIESKVHAALNQLTEAQRQCLLLFYFEKKSYRDIADTTGFEVGKVKSHIQNGRRNLKNILLQDREFRKDE
ncbi:MAG: RNA polymerase sigma factor [Candidatus Zhuqueibacterota bacterium]